MDSSTSGCTAIGEIALDDTSDKRQILLRIDSPSLTLMITTRQRHTGKEDVFVTHLLAVVNRQNTTAIAGYDSRSWIITTCVNDQLIRSRPP